jgi:ATP-dependent Lhr-like helicase
MSPFDMLSEPIRKYIREKRWEELRPIQAAAIQKILTTEYHYILAARTASGKTEAAFLPILTKVDFNQPGVQVLYISPMIALINDQFFRVEELCEILDVKVTKWHGEAKKSLKDKLLQHPEGILLITPESLESMFINKLYHVKQLFTGLKFIVIDEIHSFLGTDRGIQLQSLLFRLRQLKPVSFRIIGLSATIGDYEQAKAFTGEPANTKVILDKTANEIITRFKYFKRETEDLPLPLLKDLYLETKDKKVLIFPNDRATVEEVAVKLKKIAAKTGGHTHYFSHHSSVDKEVREYVEFFAKNNQRENFCIACTSTLELGIDIGSVDEIVQIDTTHSISSLIQRAGRSGRRKDSPSRLVLYGTEPWSLLQALACWQLFKEGYIEPPYQREKPYDILVHQALAVTKSYSGVAINRLVKELKENFSFRNITEEEIREIIIWLTETDMLEQIGQEVIIGVKGEKTVNNFDFYSCFKTDKYLRVVCGGNRIGEVPFSPEIKEDTNILLAANIWKIVYVDRKANIIEVTPTRDGKKPEFNSLSTDIHPRIREKMMELLFSETPFRDLDEPGTDIIERMRRDFLPFDLKDLSCERPLLQTPSGLKLFSFTGTKINRTIKLLLDIAGIENTVFDHQCFIDIHTSPEELVKKGRLLAYPLTDPDASIRKLLTQAPSLINFSKWGHLLPVKYQVPLIREQYYDIENTINFLRSIKLINGSIN